MPQFGAFNPFPFKFGGGKSDREAELIALLDAYAPAWDSSPETANYAECLAYAQLIACIWQINRRLKNQALPMRMLEALTDWEQVTRLRPSAGDLDNDRRRAVAAKLRGVAGNTIGDIYDTCATIFGIAFIDLVFADSSDDVTYWPGINPGPPGFEWSTTRYRMLVQVDNSGMQSSQFQTKRSTLLQQLDIIAPAWMTFDIGVGDEFIVNQSIVGQGVV